jgi:hypothetical protein
LEAIPLAMPPSDEGYVRELITQDNLYIIEEELKDEEEK